ncbi:helix-turn-helix transcriptional regulator [Halobacillus litoralis]|uniref:helix-turn-helix transcriptional regulator n=1 Tax=Halobacillus TaxID=45667 RepID=UPI00248FF304|nr:helix-turn-helix transcriptional regulator [Halobacillus litoralis]
MKNKKLKMARAEHDLSQQELAKTVGVSRQTIGLIELGKYNPSLQLCLSICWVLDKSLDDLFWQEKEDT